MRHRSLNLTAAFMLAIACWATPTDAQTLKTESLFGKESPDGRR